MTVDGVRVHSREAGNGTPVVLVHGLAVSSRYFLPTVAALQPSRRAAAVDLPGFGLSDAAPGCAEVEGLADWLARWLRATGRVGAPVVANSAGCQFAVACAERQPDVIGPLVLVGPTLDPALRSVPASLGRWALNGMSKDIVQVPIIVRDLIDIGLPRFFRAYRSVLHDRIEDRLPSVRQRVLVVRGTRDKIASHAWAQEVAALLPDAELAEIRGAAHTANLTHGRQLAHLVVEFCGRRRHRR